MSCLIHLTCWPHTPRQLPNPRASLPSKPWEQLNFSLMTGQTCYLSYVQAVPTIKTEHVYLHQLCVGYMWWVEFYISIFMCGFVHAIVCQVLKCFPQIIVNSELYVLTWSVLFVWRFLPHWSGGDGETPLDDWEKVVSLSPTTPSDQYGMVQYDNKYW